MTYPVVWKRGFKKLAECKILGHAENANEAMEILRAETPAEIAGSFREGCELLDRGGELAWEPKYSMVF